MPPSARVVEVAATRPTVEAASADGSRSPSDMWRMSRAISRAPLDVLLYPTVYSYVPVWSRARKLVMIHDVIAERFPDLTLPRTMGRWFWQTKVALARWQADLIVTVSEHSRRQIAAHFGLPINKVRVVGEASDPVFRRLRSDELPGSRLAELKLNDARRKLIYVGGFNPHKNLEMLVDVFARLAAEPDCDDLQLVMVGSTGNRVFHSYVDTVRARIAACGVQDRVVFTGYLSDDDLVRLLNVGTALVLPSLLEGFGLPAVEAAACGCPVVATTESPLPDLLGEGGIFIAPRDTERWLTELRRVVSDAELRRRMSEAGSQAAARLTWQAAAEQLLELIDRGASR
jgi:glycosyltransferase involved in cell wall biosynthesis